MSTQDDMHLSLVSRPRNPSQEDWKEYWKAQGQKWRTEPEIDEERQKYLAERRAIIPDIGKGIYPFKEIRLSRADVEWLLATHDNGGGPVVWADSAQRARQGLDLRGANLKQIDLSHLPLARLCGGLTNEWSPGLVDTLWKATLHLEETNLTQAHLEGAILRDARLDQATLDGAYIEEANLNFACLEGAFLGGADLQGSSLFAVHLERANLYMANLMDANLRRARLEEAVLEKVNLANEKGIGPLVAHADWNKANLNVVNWSQVKMLGDEYEARQKKHDGLLKEKAVRLDEYEEAVRANRQLSIGLQGQGLNEVATRFAYRAQRLQRVLLRLQSHFGQYLFSLFLDVLAGFGYRPVRSILWYLTIIFGYAIAYSILGHLPFLPDAIVFSLTSFHGRGFFPGLGSETSLHSPLVVLAALEAVVGLLIEISFIATFTQRFFGK